MADHRLADSDGVGRPGLLALAGLLPVLLLGGLDMVAVIARAQPVVGHKLYERFGDLGAVTFSIYPRVKERSDVGLGEREGRHVRAQRHCLHDAGFVAIRHVFVGDLFDLGPPRCRDRLFKQSRGSVERH